MTTQTLFSWKCEPQAEALIQGVLDAAAAENQDIAHLQDELVKHTSSRLFDWLDHVIVGFTPEFESRLEEAGFVPENATPTYRVFHHPAAQLPRVVVHDHDHPIVGVAVSVESIADFLMIRGQAGWIEGSPLSGYRRCQVSTDNGVSQIGRAHV